MSELTAWRIPGRKHNEVRSHLSRDDGRHMLCGRDDDNYELEFGIIEIKVGCVMDWYGNRPIIHVICRKCLQRVEVGDQYETQS